MWTLNKYGIIALKRNVIKESHSPYSFPYSERHLQCTWYDSSLRPKTMMSSESKKITIVHPGRWNLEAGPDFLDAILAIGSRQKIIKGDVEIHIHPNDWIHHKHTNDPRYSNVIAHVTYFPGTTKVPDTNMIHIALKDILQAHPHFSFDNIDISAYPYHNITNTVPPCACALKKHQLESFDLLLNTAGHARINQKTDRIRQAMKTKDHKQVFYEEIMCALGYKNNRIPFRRLAQLIPLETIQSESNNNCTTAYALLLGVSGLMPALKPTSCRNTRSFIRLLWDHWWHMENKWSKNTMPRKAWCLSGLRPQNHPARRLAAAAVLFTSKPSLLEQIERLDFLAPDKSHKQISSLFEKAQMPFWENKLSFYGKEQKKKATLIGPQRIAAITSNVIIPYLAARDVPIENLIESLPPEQDHNTTRQVANILLGPDHNPALYRTGLKQQGLIQIFQDFCLNNKSGCDHCTLGKALEHESAFKIYRADK